MEAAKKLTSLTGKRVVVCEDEGITQLHLSVILEQSGMSLVRTVRDGKSAVKAVEDTNPDIVVLDIKCEGMNGLDAAEQILQESKRCVVLVSAYSSPDFYRRAEELGVCGYIPKPFDPDTFLPQLETAYKNFVNTYAD